MTTTIDKQIEVLQAKKHDNAIRANLKKHCYDTLFFTYEANYKKKVHFAYFASSSCYGSYAILCKEDAWLSSSSDKGHPLDMIKLLEKEAIFMDWGEATRDMCPECKKYLPLSQIVLGNAKALRLEGDKRLGKATLAKEALYQQASRLENIFIKKVGGTTREDFLKLPVEERRKILAVQAENLADNMADSQAKEDFRMMD